MLKPRSAIGLDMPPPHHLDPEGPDFTVADVAGHFGVRPESVRRWLAEGGFPGAYRMGTGPKAVWKIPQASVIAWITRRQT
jgi:hypothetical protein